MRQGRKSFGTEKSDKGITKDLSKMHMKNAFQPCHKDALSSDEHKKVLSTIMLLKEKDK